MSRNLNKDAPVGRQVLVFRDGLLVGVRPVAIPVKPAPKKKAKKNPSKNPSRDP